MVDIATHKKGDRNMERHLGGLPFLQLVLAVCSGIFAYVCNLYPNSGPLDHFILFFYLTLTIFGAGVMAWWLRVFAVQT